jgi:chaperonin GroEL
MVADKPKKKAKGGAGAGGGMPDYGGDDMDY